MISGARNSVEKRWSITFFIFSFFVPFWLI
jgi:hypothetical protein